MIILIADSSHTGKTVLSQKILEKYSSPYLSIDHLKMGLIRSHQTHLTPSDDSELTPYLWSIVKEIIKTVIENNQNLVIEGCYIPFDWQNYFSSEYILHIKYYCLVMSETYINRYFNDILFYANEIESRIDDSWCTKEKLIIDNEYTLKQCQQHNLNYIWIDKDYSVDLILH